METGYAAIYLWDEAKKGFKIISTFKYSNIHTHSSSR